MSGALLYREAELAGRGRGLVAVADIQPGQLIFREEAVAVGPLHDRQKTVTAWRPKPKLPKLLSNIRLF